MYRGDPITKRCRRCDEVKPLEVFVKNGVHRGTGRQIYHSYCRPCWQEYKLERKAARARGDSRGRKPAATFCRDCKIPLNTANRVPSGVSRYTNKQLYANRCRTCIRRYARERYSALVPDREVYHRQHLMRNYGITAQEYADLETRQGGVCAVCRQEERDLIAAVRDEVCRIRRLAVDHDHQTGKIRGLLCNRCNRALGMLGDDYKLLEAGAKYLREADTGL